DPALLTLFAELTDALEDLTIASEGLAQQNQRLKARQRSLRAERQRYHQAEVALQTSERRYDDLIQIAPVGIFWFDLDGQCTYVNPAWGALTGYPIETAWGLGWLQTVHPDDQAALLTNLQQWLAAPGGHPHQDEARIVRPDGTVRWFYAQISPDYGGDGTLRGYVGSLTDVTDRKQAETTLKATQDSLELALEAAEMGTWSLDLTQDVAPCRSLRHDQIFGYSTPQAEWGQEIAKRHVLEADREIFEAAFARALTTGNLDFEVRIRWPDGSIHWMASRGRFFFDPDGHPLWAHGINYDITARKQAEAALRANERKLKAIFNSTFQLMGLLTIDGLLIDANQAALTLIEAELADVVGQPFWETPWWTDFPEQQQTLQGAIARAAQGEFVRLETRHRWADGSLAWVDFSLKPVRDEADNIVMLVPEGRDITARKQAELALQQSEATFRNFAENSRAVIWIAEDPQCLTHGYVNPAFADIWGQPWEAVKMQPDGWAQTIHPDDRDQATRQFAQERTGIFHPTEYRILRPDGTIRWIRDQGFPIRNAAGDIYLFGGIAQDITAHKEAEAALHQREEFLSTIFTGAEQAIFVIEVTPGPEFRYLEFNSVAERYSTLTTAQVKGQTPEAAFGATIGAAMRHHYEACVVAGDKTAYEEHLVFPHQTLWTLTTLFPLRDEDGHIHRLVGTAIDISGRKHLELSLQASEAKLSQILDSAIIAISSFRVYADYNFEYEYWSAGCERLYGYPLSAYRDRDFWLSKVVAEDREQILMPLFADFFAERDVTVEYRFWRQDGALRWFASTYTARQITPTCWMVTSVNHDITDRKQAELSLQQQIRQEYLLADIAQDIRRSLNLTEVLTHTVERVRDFLHTDRVVLFRFRPDWQGDVIMESVGDGWLSLVGTTFHDPCFAEHYIQPYCRGHVSLMTDIDEGDRAPCYVELLRPLQVKASLAVPILQGEQLWGLLIAHHCVAPRTWQPAEIALLRRLATQVGIAIQQSELYGQTRRELLERQRMQQVIEESEERFRTLSTAAPVGICQTTADGICLYTNTRWQEMSGLSFADSLGDGWQRAIHPGDRAAVLHAWETHLANQGECQAEFRLLTPQGQTRWVAARAATIQAATGEAIGSVCVYADITEQKETAQKVQEQAALLDIASDAIFVRDLDNRIIYWNQGAERLYGWAAAEAVGQPADQLLRAADPAIAAILAKLSPQDEWQGEICNTTRTGQQVTVASRWTLVRDEAGQPRSILTVDTDVTEKKQLQAQFYRAQRLESLGRLASGNAHDLNNVFTH
ncbi:MAG TPA: PAS domain S-box protein, partial [Candidatus Obscuribacterales bacterium]